MVAAAQILEHLDRGLAVSGARVFRFRTAVTAVRMALFAALGVGLVVFVGMASVAIANAMGASGITGIYLNRRGKTFDGELVDDLSFGPMEEILHALLTRVSAGA